MAASLTSGPQPFHMGFNPISFVLDSTEKNEAGFRYILQINNSDDTQFRKVVSTPNINDGKGYFDISRIIQDRMTMDIPMNQGDNPYNFTNSTTTYKVHIGQSYIQSWNFDDYIFLSGDRLALQNATTNHPFALGDQIEVSLNSTYSDNRALLNGFFTIIGIENSKTIVLNIPYGYIGAGALTPGKVKYADHRTIENINLTGTTYKAMNGAQQGSTFDTLQGAINTGFITEFPNGFTMRHNQTLSLAYNLEGLSNRFCKIKNSLGYEISVPLNKEVGSLLLGSQYVGDSSLWDPKAKWIDVWLNYSTSVNTPTKRINLDWRCSPQNIEIAFLDRSGSWGSFAFDLKHTIDYTSKKEDFLTYNNPAIIEPAKILRTKYNTDYTKIYTLNTNWMNEATNIYFEQLMTSRYTFMKLGTKWYDVTVKDSTITTDSERFTKLIRKTIQVEFNKKEDLN